MKLVENFVALFDVLEFASLHNIFKSLVHANLHCNNVMMVASEEDEDDDASRRGGDRRSRSFRGIPNYSCLRVFCIIHNFGVLDDIHCMNCIRTCYNLLSCVFSDCIA